MVKTQSAKTPSGADDLAFNLDNEADVSEEVEGHAVLVASPCQSKHGRRRHDTVDSPGKQRIVDLHTSFGDLDLYAKVKKDTRDASQAPSAAGLHLCSAHLHCPTILLDIDRSYSETTCAT